MSEKEKLLLEQQELNRLIEEGFSFTAEIERGVVLRSYLWGLRKKKGVKKEKRTFTIEEPTLSTLDRLSREFIQFSIQEETLKEKGMEAMKQFAHKHSLRCAKIIAIAVLGEDYLIPKMGKRGVSYKRDDKALDKLSAQLARGITPSRLLQLTIALNAMCNFGDFMRSIRLLAAERTTAPIRVEGKKAD